MCGIIPFRPSGNDMAVIMRPFGWRLWIFVLASPFIFLIPLVLSDKVFNGVVNWWRQIDFILRSMMMDSSVPFQGLPVLVRIAAWASVQGLPIPAVLIPVLGSGSQFFEIQFQSLEVHSHQSPVIALVPVLAPFLVPAQVPAGI